MNGNLIEGLIGLLGGSLIITGIIKLLEQYGVFDKYMWVVLIIGMLLFYFRKEIVFKILGRTEA